MNIIDYCTATKIKDIKQYTSTLIKLCSIVFSKKSPSGQVSGLETTYAFVQKQTKINKYIAHVNMQCMS